MLNNNISIALYIHIPWCVRKCPYCDFNSHQRNSSLPEDAYVDALLADLAQDLERFNIERPLASIFIGGGTPSLFSASAINKLLSGIDQRWGIPGQAEITLEANPGTVEQQHIADYYKAGINRLSIGVQSFNDAHLARLGRIHSSDEASKALQTARDAGFDNINLDLMFGLPEQSIEQGLSDLQQAIELAPEHLSWYQLTLEPNTVFYKKPPTLPNADHIADLQELGQALLSKAHYSQYEISAYSKAQKQCQHNRNYWEFGDYLGIGAGAHGKITQANGSVVRTRKKQQPSSYLNADDVVATSTPIAEEQLPFEYMLNALRLNAPIDIRAFKQRTQQPINSIKVTLTKARQIGLITIEKNMINKTALGENFINDLLTLFLT